MPPRPALLASPAPPPKPRPAPLTRPALLPKPTGVPGAMLLSADPAGLAGVHLAPLASRGVVPSLAWAVVRGLGVAALANTAGPPPSPLDQAVLSTLGS